jgi:hypothetical protein
MQYFWDVVSLVIPYFAVSAGGAAVPPQTCQSVAMQRPSRGRNTEERRA